MKKLLLYLVGASALFGTNYKTGIDLDFSGTFAIERPWADPAVLDRKIVYLTDTTTITASHNARNYYWSGGNPDQNYIGASDAFAVIRYRVDRDFQWKYHFAGNGGIDLLPAYSTPLTFATLTYDGSTPVVGSTGYSTGAVISPATKNSEYWRGMVGPFNNDEYHILTFGDDDGANPGKTSNFEFWASDGAVHAFVVNPKTPALVIAGTGDAQWYTTPCKAYFQPRIVGEKTYFNANSGTLSFTITDINGNNVSYRINGGSWVNVGASSVVLTPSDFPLTGAGTPNTLDYYYAGSGSTSNFKTRPMIKNPGFPSAGESHGENFLLPGDTWTKRIAQLSNVSTNAYYWRNFYDTQPNTNFRTQVQNNWLQGYRSSFVQRGAMEGIIAKIKGPNVQATGAGITLTYLQLLHRLAIDNVASIDNVGLEKRQSGVSASVSASLGSRENIDRGYYDVNLQFDLFMMYDLAMGYFRTDQGFTIAQGGFTPIDDYKMRDDCARVIEESAIFNNNFWDPGITGTGMWDTARNLCGLGGCYVIPSYSSEVFGTCGLDGNTTTYLFNPFPYQQYTWKTILVDQNYTVGTFPDLNRGFGLENSPAGLFSTNGTYRDKQSYLSMTQMGHAISLGITMSRIHNPSRVWPCTTAGINRMFNGTIRGLVTTDEGTGQYNIVTMLNRLYPDSAAGGFAWASQFSNTGSNDQRMQLNMTRSFAPGLLWIEEPPLPKDGQPTTTTISP